MTARLFTFISEFRGTTNVSQVSALDERAAVQAWGEKLRAQQPFARASSPLAKSVEASSEWKQPVAISGMSNVWCISATCGGDLMLANIVETAARTKTR